MKDDSTKDVKKQIESTAYPNLSKADNTKIIVIGSLAAIILIFILSILFPTNNDNESTGESSATEVTTENTTEKQIDTGWQTIDGELRYVRNDGKIAKNQWVDGHFVGASGVMYTSAVTPDGKYVDYNGDIDKSMGITGSKQGMWELQRQLKEMINGYSGTWSLYIKDLSHNEYISINNVQHFSASMIKLFCAATAYDLIDKGTLKETPQIDSLMQQMISVSDNDAFNLMVMNCGETYSHVAGREVIQKYIDKEGYKDTTIATILVPTKYKAPSSPGRNYTTVEDCGLMMEKIYKGKCVNEKYSKEFLNLLLNQEHVNKIPAGLPEGTKCANKTGDTDEIQHDAAIVYSPGGDYIIAVMSSNCGAAITNIQAISKLVYEYFNP